MACFKFLISSIRQFFRVLLGVLQSVPSLTVIINSLMWISGKNDFKNLLYDELKCYLPVFCICIQPCLVYSELAMWTWKAACYSREFSVQMFVISICDSCRFHLDCVWSTFGWNLEVKMIAGVGTFSIPTEITFCVPQPFIINPICGGRRNWKCLIFIATLQSSCVSFVIPTTMWRPISIHWNYSFIPSLTHHLANLRKCARLQHIVSLWLSLFPKWISWKTFQHTCLLAIL